MGDAPEVISMATGIRCTVLVTVDIVRERFLSMKRRGEEKRRRKGSSQPKLSRCKIVLPRFSSPFLPSLAHLSHITSQPAHSQSADERWQTRKSPTSSRTKPHSTIRSTPYAPSSTRGSPPHSTHHGTPPHKTHYPTRPWPPAPVLPGKSCVFLMFGLSSVGEPRADLRRGRTGWDWERV